MLTIHRSGAVTHMPHIRSSLDLEYIGNLLWEIKLKEAELEARAGLGRNYINKCKRHPTSVRLSTVDRLYGAIARRMGELAQAVPDDLWERLVRHEFLDDEGKPLF